MRDLRIPIAIIDAQSFDIESPEGEKEKEGRREREKERERRYIDA